MSAKVVTSDLMGLHGPLDRGRSIRIVISVLGSELMGSTKVVNFCAFFFHGFLLKFHSTGSR